MLHPRSVAVYGASDSREKFGGRIMHFLVQHGFAGEIVPINPRRAEICGRRAYPRVTDAPNRVDVAIIAVPPGLAGGRDHGMRRGRRRVLRHHHDRVRRGQ
ncbi:MAG: CoA-binding protein [Acetobacteraceae bacterium]